MRTMLRKILIVTLFAFPVSAFAEVIFEQSNYGLNWSTNFALDTGTPPKNSLLLFVPPYTASGTLREVRVAVDYVGTIPPLQIIRCTYPNDYAGCAGGTSLDLVYNGVKSDIFVTWDLSGISMTDAYGYMIAILNVQAGSQVYGNISGYECAEKGVTSGATSTCAFTPYLRLSTATGTPTPDISNLNIAQLSSFSCSGLGIDPCAQIAEWFNASLNVVAEQIDEFTLASTSPFSYIADVGVILDEMDTGGTTSIKFEIPVFGRQVTMFDTASTTTYVGASVKNTWDNLYTTILALSVVFYFWVRLKSLLANQT